jgi:hypothetical protein
VAEDSHRRGYLTSHAGLFSSSSVLVLDSKPISRTRRRRDEDLNGRNLLPLTVAQRYRQYSPIGAHGHECGGGWGKFVAGLEI